MIEKEVRFKVSNSIINEIIRNTEIVKEKKYTLDIVLGEYGFDSLSKNGYIVRLRTKNNKTHLEVKKRLNKNDWEEYSISIDDTKSTIKILETLGLKTYLFISRYREERKYNNLHIFIDNVDLLGDFVEMEYQESNYDEVIEFISKFNIENKEQELYGDIFKYNIENDIEFKKEFDIKLNEIINKEGD